MENDLKRFKVSIFGDTYSLVSDESDDLLLKAAKIVDTSLKDIVANKHVEVDSKKIAVLVALQFAVENLKNHQANTIVKKLIDII